MNPEINDNYINKKLLDEEVQNGTLNIEQQRFYNDDNTLFKCHILDSDNTLDRYILSSFQDIEDDIS